MSLDTSIEWTDATASPWIGCTKVSPGCAHCYAEHTTRARVLRARGAETWGRGAARAPVATFGAAIERLDQKAWREGRPQYVFPSLCDWLDAEVPLDLLAHFLRHVRKHEGVIWQLLSKRPENFFPRLRAVVAVMSAEEAAWVQRWLAGEAPGHVWVGVSVEDQKRADERIPELFKIPASVRFLSCEPLLGPLKLKLTAHVERHGVVVDYAEERIHWVIVGGESGTGARECNVRWVDDIVAQCVLASVPVFVKQLGANCTSLSDDFPTAMSDIGVDRVLWAANFTHRKGGDPAEWPERLRVRQWPAAYPAPASLSAPVAPTGGRAA